MSHLELLEKLALFFYFSILDESRAQSATVRAIRKIKMDLLKKKIKEDEFTVSDFVRVTSRLMESVKKHDKPTTLAYSSNYIVLPEKSNWGPWFELKKALNEREFRSLLYSKVLKLTDVEIATGLDLPVGTVRYRIGRALKVLGTIHFSGATSHERHH